MNDILIEKTAKEKVLTKYSYQEVYDATLKYFNNDDAAADIWINKYCLKDSFGNYYEQTPDDMHKRLVKEFARIEKKYPNPLSENLIYDKIKEFKKIIPQGSPMAGIGNDFQIISISNCFVIGNNNNSDSYGGIMKIDEEIVQLQKRRAGVGTFLEHIRPKGSPVKNSALTSTGVVPWMERYSNSTREVAQEGRRGALLLSTSIRHPDAEDFIDAKLIEGKVTGANISVKIHDDFMNAVISGTTYIQQFPVYDKNPKITKEINASKLWKKIIHNAWLCAEPGILFWDTIIRESIPDCYAHLGFRSVTTNPSLRYNTLILTKNGVFPIKDLADNNPNIFVRNILGKWQPAKVFMSGENKELYEIEFTNGQKIYATKEHKHPIFNTSGNIINPQTGKVIKKQTIELKRGDKVYLPTFNESPINIEKSKLNFDDGFICGWITGDGWVSWHKTNETFTYGFIFSKTDKQNGISDKIINFINEKLDDRKISLRENKGCYETYCANKKIRNYFDEIGLSHKSNGIPTKIWESNHEFIKGFIDGIFSSDGYVDEKRNRIILTSKYEKLLLDIQKLLNFYGIRSYIRKSVISSNFSATKEKKYIRYDLYIGTLHCEKFAKIFSLTHNEKNKKLKSFIGKNFGKIRNNRDYIVIKSVTKSIYIEDVYDITVYDETHTFQMEGGITGNCGEIVLCVDDSCRLLSINLYGYVKNPFTKNAHFDWEEFKKDVIIAERLMDDIVDLELEKIDKILEKINSDPESEDIKKREIALWIRIKDKAIKGRRTGLGVTAEGDMLAALGLIYGTDIANAFSNEVHKTLKLNAYRSSVVMAKERGAFPIFSVKLEEYNPFILRIKKEDPDLWNEMQFYGRRNIALLTIAPVGSGSMLTQTTSGIECAFLILYFRKRKVNPNDKNVRVDYIDKVGDQWMEYPVFHHKFEVWLEVNGYDVNDIKNNWNKNQINDLIKKSPYYKATSNDVDWIKKIEMQGMIQKHVDHSISVTVNLPEDINEEIVAKIYETGWKVGCKGITIYRDKSRDGVLVSESIKDKKKEDGHVPKRPKRLKADIHRFQNNLEKWIAVVGIKDNKPYEIFTGELSNGISELPISIINCEVIKNKDEKGNKSYDIEYIDSEGNKKIIIGLNRCFNPEFWNLAKMISGLMRQGMPPLYIYELVNSLNLADEHLNTWKNGVARTIKRYIKDGEQIEGVCPNCGSNKLQYIEGCKTCIECGSSACS